MDEDNGKRESPRPLTSHLDLLVTQTLSKLAPKASRRSFLTRIGRLTLTAAGATFVSALPADRRVANAHNLNCTDWRWCYMGGYPCGCCSPGFSNDNCPYSCTRTGTYWSACCYNPNNGFTYQVYYYDCCSGEGDCPYLNCGCHCHTAAEPYWCNAAQLNPNSYRCTLAIVGDFC